MSAQQGEVNRWVVRLVKLSVAASVIAIVGWYALQFRSTPPAAKAKSSAQLVAVLRDGAESGIARIAAADAIDEADASTVGELTAELSRGDALGRELAARTMARLRTEETDAVEALIAALADPEPDVRQQAAAALRRIGARPAEIAAALAQRTRHAEPHVRREAVIELGRLANADESVLDALRIRLSDSDPGVRAEALAALARHSAASIDELLAGLHDEVLEVRMTACTLLGRMGGQAEPALPELAKLLAADDLTAVSASNGLRNVAKQNPQLLAPLLDSQAERVAATAARSIWASGRMTEQLREPLLNHIDAPGVAEYAFSVLRRTGLEGRLRPPELIDALEQAGDAVISLLLQANHVLRGRVYGMPFYYPTYRGGDGVTDEDLTRLGRLRNLRLLDLSGNPIGDAGLEQIAGCEKLEWLLLYDTKVTSAGLAHLATLTRLRTLALGGCKITDEGLEHLQALPALEALDLRQTQVTDSGMQRLAALKRLKAIWVDQTQVTDAGLAPLNGLPLLEDLGYPTKQFTLRGLSQLKGLLAVRPQPASVVDDDLALLVEMPRLRELVLSHSGVTDAGLTHIGKLTQLESLWLDDTAIADAGLPKLRSLTNLKTLYLAKTRTTEPELEALQQALPKLDSWLVPNKVPRTMRNPLDDVVGLKEIVEADAAPSLP